MIVVRKRKLKKKRVFLCLILLVILIILIISLIVVNKDIKVVLEKKRDIEINTKASLHSFIKKVNNGKLDTKNKEIDTSKLGKQKLEVVVFNKFKKKKVKFDINIVDTKKPEIEASDEIKTKVGQEVDLLKDVKVTDNSLEEIKATVVGDYDFKKEGKYSLKYSAKDSSGNEELKEFNLIVEKVSVENNNSNNKTDNKTSSNTSNNTFKTSKGFSGKTVNGVTYIDGVLIANKTYSLPAGYGSGLLSSTQEAFNKMKADATALGYSLYIGSGFRSYSTQKVIYNNYVARDGQTNADTYSARAGHSEHQSGLAFDVCDSNVSACITSEFDSSNQAKWINDNCYKYGLILRYPKGKTNQTGYMYESWHLRYVGVELASKLYNNGNWITLEEYFGIDSKYK